VLNKKLTRLAKRYPKAAGRIKKRAATAALKELVLRTPVDTGLARGSWRVTQNIGSRAQPTRRDKSGGKTIAAGMRIIARSKPSNDLVISNVANHTGLINTGAIKITKARPFAGPGFVENALRRAQISVAKDSIFRDMKF